MPRIPARRGERLTFLTLLGVVVLLAVVPIGRLAQEALAPHGRFDSTMIADVLAKKPFVFCFMMPLMIAPQVTALAWINLLGPNSTLLRALGLAPAPGSPHPLYGPGGIVLLLGIEQAPVVFLAVRAGLRALPRDLVEAAQASGAAPWRIVRTIVLPLAGPSVAAGGML